MTHTCLRDEELALLAERTGDPRLREVEQCASCRSRLAAFRSFLLAADVPAGARPEEADARLRSALDTEIYGSPREAALPAAHRQDPPPAGDRHPEGGVPGRFFRSLWRPGFRLAWGAAIVILAFVGIRSSGLLGPGGGESTVLRDGGRAGAPGMQIVDPVRDPSGALRLGWSAVAGADRYEVVVHGEGFAERERIDAGARTGCVIPAESLATLAAAGGTLYWRVLAYQKGDLVAQSRIAPLAPAGSD